MEMSYQFHVPVALPPGERASVAIYRTQVGIRAGVDAVTKKKSVPVGNQTRQACSQSLYWHS